MWVYILWFSWHGLNFHGQRDTSWVSHVDLWYALKGKNHENTRNKVHTIKDIFMIGNQLNVFLESPTIGIMSPCLEQHGQGRSTIDCTKKSLFVAF